MTDMSEATIAIQQTLNRYMQAIDRADVFTLRSRVFTADARIKLIDEVDLDGYCSLVSGIMTSIKTQHFLFNSVIDVQGASAVARSYFVGYHRVSAGDNGEASTALFGVHEAEIDSVIGGVYE